MGSGTTAIAAMELNRKYIGSEIDKTFYDHMIKRIENAKQAKEKQLITTDERFNLE